MEQKNKFILLISVSESEENFILGKLKQNGIHAVSEKDQTSSLPEIYGGASFGVVNIFVREEQLESAKVIIE